MTGNKADKPQAFLFVAVKNKVMRGLKEEARACSFTMAKRIANALNEYRTNERGR